MRGWLRGIGFGSALFATACFGGQTGEITELGACREPVGVRGVDEPSADGSSARATLDAVETSIEVEVTLQDSPTSLTIAYAASGEPATLLGGPECPEPWVEVPVSIEVRTADGALAETIEGVALSTAAPTITVRGSVPLSLVRGTFDPSTLGDDVDPSRDTLEVELWSEPAALAGRIAVRTGSADPVDRELAAF